MKLERIRNPFQNVTGSKRTSTLDEFPDIDQHHPGRYVNPDAPITDTMQRQLDEVLAFSDSPDANK